MLPGDRSGDGMKEAEMKLESLKRRRGGGGGGGSGGGEGKRIT